MGTAFCKNELGTIDNHDTVAPTGLTAYAKLMYKIGNDVLKTQLASERAWKYWIDAKTPPPEHTHRYRRLNVPLDFEPEMDHVEELDEFARLAEEYVKGEAQQITSIANQLVASSFYYQFDKQDLHENSNETEKGWKCKGL